MAAWDDLAAWHAEPNLADLKSALTFKKVRSASRAGDDTIQTTLFRGDRGQICGWFLGPVRFTAAGIDLPYLPRSDQTLASVAVMRAVKAARASNTPVCIIDPDDLWEPAWRG